MAKASSAMPGQRIRPCRCGPEGRRPQLRDGAAAAPVPVSPGAHGRPWTGRDGSKELIDLNATETTLRLQHQTDRGR